MSIVIIGAGLAGGTAATELREQGYDGKVVLVGAEEHPPYERPPLSKGYLLGNDALDDAFVHPRDWYAEHDVDLRLGVEATGLDTDAHVVTTSAGDITYERLLLATGAEPRRLAVAEDSGLPAAYLRTIEDSDRLREAFASGGRIAVVGAGWIGLEVAAAAREAGCEVTVFETAELPLLRVLGPTVAQVFADLHREHGVDLRLGASVSADDLRGADLVVAGVGVSPRLDLARSGGLAVDDGVLVDAGLRTSVPSVFAVGDIASHAHPVLGRRIRVEHWDTAINQAKVAAHNLAGADEAYDAMPYFFTDQYDLGMEYVGHAGADDEVVVHGDLDARVFRAFWMREGRVVAAMHANDWDATDDLRAAVASGDLPG
jgi:3-phenylpropionate/trans-cinnamate dioxygenase ferredoxin reductase component